MDLVLMLTFSIRNVAFLPCYLYSVRHSFNNTINIKYDRLKIRRLFGSDENN